MTENCLLSKNINVLCRGGSRIFSRGGGGGFKKKFENLDDLFFLGRPNSFFELSQSSVLPPFWLNFLHRRQIFEKIVKKVVFGHFLKNFDKKIAFFFGAGSPSKLVYIGAEGAFRKILGSVGQKWISEKVSKGGQGQILRKYGGGNFFQSFFLIWLELWCVFVKFWVVYSAFFVLGQFGLFINHLEIVNKTFWAGAEIWLANSSHSEWSKLVLVQVQSVEILMFGQTCPALKITKICRHVIRTFSYYYRFSRLFLNW